MQTNDAPQCQRHGCAFPRPLKPRGGSGSRRARFCSAACSIVNHRAHEALKTRDAAEVAEASRLIDALNARTSPRGFVPGLFPERRDAG